MNNNLTNERAIRDVFSTTSYITIGDKDKPLAYPYKPPIRSCYTGKHFQTNPGKQGLGGAKVPDVYLQKEHKWVLQGVPYADKIRYATMQPEKKKGFLTGDFKRRDEFSLNFTTEQYRERLKGELSKTGVSVAPSLTQMRELLEAELMEKMGQEAMQEKEAPPLYDLVYDGAKSYPTAVRNSMIPGRDTLNTTQLSWSRSYGPHKLSSQAVGLNGRIWNSDHAKPQFARIPIVQQTFFRKSNIPITNTLYSKQP
eukprot:CAMPEP_0183790436 /NCGR_PEP_ID=MMETSP0803_2-20130417/1065_1 /TAXON_ID=195967 /ORGANISM="Crustomastix stigmata, Strain CCMP3273" /LENGTH=253 /DNA_ID=CAMNT_0026034659 /DNA_START=94 /DNA_END=852 /DNA_ORIENTATION=+